MNLNPITAITDKLEKLIIEHGSAAVQEKHIALLKEQLAIFAQKFSSLESENATLKTENEKLVSENKNFRVANNELATKIQAYENSAHKNLLSIGVNILKFLAEQNLNEHTKTEQIAQSLNIDVQSATFYLEELKTKKMINDHYISGSGLMGTPAYTHWTLTHEGRRYLVTNKMLS